MNDQLFNLAIGFNEVFRSAHNNERNMTNLAKYKEKRIIYFALRMEQAEKIIRERMDGATLEEINDAITKASRILLNNRAYPLVAAIKAIGDWPEGPEAA